MIMCSTFPPFAILFTKNHDFYQFTDFYRFFHQVPVIKITKLVPSEKVRRTRHFPKTCKNSKHPKYKTQKVHTPQFKKIKYKSSENTESSRWQTVEATVKYNFNTPRSSRKYTNVAFLLGAPKTPIVSRWPAQMAHVSVKINMQENIFLFKKTCKK